MGTWSTAATVEERPERVLEVLTDPEACDRWSPVPFRVDDLADERLATGTRARVGGSIAGRSVGFQVDILQADDRRLALRASGPIDIEARYDALPHPAGTELKASVSVHSPGGLMGRVLTSAADALLASGALDRALARIAYEVEPETALATG